MGERVPLLPFTNPRNKKASCRAHMRTRQDAFVWPLNYQGDEFTAIGYEPRILNIDERERMPSSAA